MKWFEDNVSGDEEIQAGPLWFNQAGDEDILAKEEEIHEADIPYPSHIGPAPTPVEPSPIERQTRVGRIKKEEVVRFPLNEIPDGLSRAKKYGYRGTEQDIINAAKKLINTDGTLAYSTNKEICGDGGCIGASCCPTMIDIRIPV